MRTRWPWCLPWVFTCPRPALSSCSPTTSLRLSQEPVERHQLRAIWQKSRRVRRSGKCGPRPCAGLGSVGPRGAAAGRLAASGGRVPIIPRPQACGRSGSRRSQGHRPCCGHAQHHQASAISGRWAADNENRHHTSCPQSAPCLGHDPRKPDRTPPGQSPSCFQGNA